MKKLLAISLALLTILGVASSIITNSYPDLSEYSPSVRPKESFNIESNAFSNDTVVIKTINLNEFNFVVLGGEVNRATADSVISSIGEFNSKNKIPIFILLNSPGGSVLDGARIISAMQSSKNPIYTVCIGVCASMAAMILSYGAERLAIDRSIIMFHPASVFVSPQDSGELDKIVSRFSFLKRYVDKMDHYVAARSQQSYETFKLQSNRELWIDAEDGLKSKYIDGIVSLILPHAFTMPEIDNKLKKKIDLYDDN